MIPEESSLPRYQINWLPPFSKFRVSIHQDLRILDDWYVNVGIRCTHFAMKQCTTSPQRDTLDLSRSSSYPHTGSARSRLLAATYKIPPASTMHTWTSRVSLTWRRPEEAWEVPGSQEEKTREEKAKTAGKGGWRREGKLNTTLAISIVIAARHDVLHHGV